MSWYWYVLAVSVWNVAAFAFVIVITWLGGDT